MTTNHTLNVHRTASHSGRSAPKHFPDITIANTVPTTIKNLREIIEWLEQKILPIAKQANDQTINNTQNRLYRYFSPSKSLFFITSSTNLMQVPNRDKLMNTVDKLWQAQGKSVHRNNPKLKLGVQLNHPITLANGHLVKRVISWNILDVANRLKGSVSESINIPEEIKKVTDDPLFPWVIPRD